MKLETGLIIRKETKFDKIRKILTRIFFKEEYFLEMQLEELLQRKSVNISKIVIPKEIGKNKWKNNENMINNI